MPTAKHPLVVSLVGASILRESELPGFESISDFASESYNLAIASIKASVLQAPDLADRVHVHLVDFDVSWDRKTLGEEEARVVGACQPDILGLSCYCWNIDTLLDLAARLRVLAPRALIVLGGPSAGPDARRILEQHPGVDAVVRGEGENAFLELLRARLHQSSLHQVPGLTFRAPRGDIVENEPADSPVDLAHLPSPYRLGVTRPRGTSLFLETSRGCRFHCRFCSWMGGGRRLRYVPIDQVEADLRWALDNHITSIKLADTAINFHTERLQQLAEAVARTDPDRRLRFTYFLKPELLTQAQADLLATLPSDEIIIGVESLTPAARRAAGKPPFDPVDFERQMAWLSRVGPVTASFILGLPGDTVEGLDHTLDWMIRFDRDHPGWFHVLCLFWLAVLPGAGLHDKKDSLGFRLMPKETPYALQYGERSPDDWLRMARRSIERHYGHPKLRVEYFQKEYLMQDAPEPDRKVPIPRYVGDQRPCVLLVGALDPRWQRAFDLRPYNLRVAWLKAWLESHDELRRGWRFEWAHEDEDIPSVIAKHSPTWLVGSCDSLGPTVSLTGILEGLSEQPTLVLEGAPTAQDARSWLARLPRAAFALVGEGEMALRALIQGRLDAPGLVRRLGGDLFDTGFPELVTPLDRIPSPFQWGFIQRPGHVIAMQLGRGNPIRTFGPERVYRDLRWAIEQRHNHVVWLDASLPGEAATLAAFVGAIRRADPEGTVQHTYRLDGSQDLEGLQALLQLPARAIHVTQSSQSSPNKAWLDAATDLSRAWGARFSQSLARDATQVLRCLAPLKRPGALAGWLLTDAHVEENEVWATFRWQQGVHVHVHLGGFDRHRIRATFEVDGDPRPPRDHMDHLRKVIGRLIDRIR